MLVQEVEPAFLVGECREILFVLLKTVLHHHIDQYVDDLSELLHILSQPIYLFQNVLLLVCQGNPPFRTSLSRLGDLSFVILYLEISVVV